MDRDSLTGSLTRQDVEDAAEVAGEQFEVLAERCREFVRQFTDMLSEFISSFPVHQRVILAGGLIVGGIVGLLFGMLMPTRSAGLITALLGSAIWLSNAGFLLESSPVGGGVLLDRSPTALLIIWGVVAAIGVAIQWKWLGKPAGKKKSDDDE